MAELNKKLFKRRLAIGLLGFYSLARGIAYLPFFSIFENLPRGIELISGIVPIEVWAGAWMAIGVVALIKAIIGKDGIAVPLVCGMMVAWGTAFFYGWMENMAVNGVINNDWFSASSYIIPAIVIGILSVKGGEEVEFIE